MFKTQFDKEKLLWKGRDSVPLYNPKVSLAQVFFRTCLNFGPKIAQVWNLLRNYFGDQKSKDLFKHADK